MDDRAANLQAAPGRLGWRRALSLGILISVLMVHAGTQPAAAGGIPWIDRPAAADAEYEQVLMKGLIDNGATVIAQAEACLERARHEELRAFCTQLAADEQAAIADLQAWLLDWYGQHYLPQPVPGGYGAEEALLEAHVMTALLYNHKALLEVSKSCKVLADHDELVDLCGDMGTRLQSQARALGNWLCAWHNTCISPLHSSYRIWSG